MVYQFNRLYTGIDWKVHLWLIRWSMLWKTRLPMRIWVSTLDTCGVSESLKSSLNAALYVFSDTLVSDDDQVGSVALKH